MVDHVRSTRALPAPHAPARSRQPRGAAGRPAARLGLGREAGLP